MMAKNEITQKERLIGLDILRILSMILITLRHFIGYSGLLQLLPMFSANGILVRALEVLCGSAVNIFVLISGYFLVNFKFKWNRVLKIWGETFFYSVVCFVIGSVLCGEGITFGKLSLSFAPFLARHYWFTVAYLTLYILSPFLNKWIDALTNKEFSIIVLGGAVLLAAWTSVVYFSQGVLTGGNTGLLWFIYLYFVGAYIKKNPEKIPTLRWCGIAVAGLVICLFTFSVMKDKIAFLRNFNWLEDDSIFELALSVMLFAVFVQIKSKKQGINKIITAIGGCSFGVYLIQESCMIRQWLWYQFVKPENHADKWYLLPLALLVVLVLFVLAFAGHRIFELIYQLVEKKVSRINFVRRKNGN